MADQVLMHPTDPNRRADGKFAPGKQYPTPAPITHENARQHHARRYELQQARALMGLDQAAAERGLIPQAIGDGAGWQAATRHVAGLLFDATSTRGAAEVYRALAAATGSLTPDVAAAMATTLFGAVDPARLHVVAAIVERLRVVVLPTADIAGATSMTDDTGAADDVVFIPPAADGDA